MNLRKVLGLSRSAGCAENTAEPAQAMTSVWNLTDAT